MTKPIFKEGDRVVLNKKAPKWLLRTISPYVARRIIKRWYCRVGGYALYFLGHNGRGLDIRMYGFRAYMLEHYVPLPENKSYKRAQTLQSKTQKSMRDNTAKAGKAVP